LSQRRPRSRGAGPGGTPGGARGIALLAAALIIGVVVLNKTDRTPSISAVRTGSPTTTTTRRSATSTTLTTVARAARPPAEVKVLPVNATKISGLGGKTAALLKKAGYTNTLAAADATQTLDATQIQYAGDSEPEARAVAAALGLPATVVKPLDSPPVADTKGAQVVVLAGPDLSTSAASTSGPTTTSGATATTRTTPTTRAATATTRP